MTCDMNNRLATTTSLINQVNFLYQNTGFPVRPCTGTVQRTVVPAFKCAWAQSVAARVTRKKMSEKTHELEKLISDGTHKNTAEMLLASFYDVFEGGRFVNFYIVNFTLRGLQYTKKNVISHY